VTVALGAAHSAARFTADQRAEAVRLYREERLSQVEIARRIGCHRETVARWFYDAFPHALPMPASTRRVRKATTVEEAKERAEREARK
jgi:transposase-like protein